jgi:hypothetical protein
MGIELFPGKSLREVKTDIWVLSNIRHCASRERTDKPDYSDLRELEHDWSCSVNGEVTEMIPQDTPDPLGKYVTLKPYIDGNLIDEIITGQLVTGILHMINKTPLDWVSKKQATIETTTYGSNFVAAQICVEQIIDSLDTL